MMLFHIISVLVHNPQDGIDCIIEDIWLVGMDVVPSLGDLINFNVRVRAKFIYFSLCQSVHPRVTSIDQGYWNRWIQLSVYSLHHRPLGPAECVLQIKEPCLSSIGVCFVLCVCVFVCVCV